MIDEFMMKSCLNMCLIMSLSCFQHAKIRCESCLYKSCFPYLYHVWIIVQIMFKQCINNGSCLNQILIMFRLWLIHDQIMSAPLFKSCWNHIWIIVKSFSNLFTSCLHHVQIVLQSCFNHLQIICLSHIWIISNQAGIISKSCLKHG